MATIIALFITVLVGITIGALYILDVVLPITIILWLIDILGIFEIANIGTVLLWEIVIGLIILAFWFVLIVKFGLDKK